PIVPKRADARQTYPGREKSKGRLAGSTSRHKRSPYRSMGSPAGPWRWLLPRSFLVLQPARGLGWPASEPRRQQAPLRRCQRVVRKGNRQRIAGGLASLRQLHDPPKVLFKWQGIQITRIRERCGAALRGELLITRRIGNQS